VRLTARCAASASWSPLESLNDGTVGTQVFGVTLDDVKALRIRVDGAWRDLDVWNSSFYLDLQTSGFRINRRSRGDARERVEAASRHAAGG